MTVIHKPPQRDNILVILLMFGLAGAIVAYAVLTNHPQWWLSLGVATLLVAVALPRVKRLLQPIDIHLTSTAFERHQEGALISQLPYSDITAVSLAKKIVSKKQEKIPVPVLILESQVAEPVKLDIYRTNEYKVRPILKDLLPRLPASVTVAQEVRTYAQTGALPDVYQLPDV